MMLPRKTWKTSMKFISAYCFIQAFYSHNIYQQFVKKGTGRTVSNSLFFAGGHLLL